MNTTQDINRPVIFETDKKQTFLITENGEFVDNIYRELDPSPIFSRIIGRNQFEPHSKKVFSNADIVKEGYLHKKGSWMKNWKKRYFILRKDIQQLCYFTSREDLTILGCIVLDSDTKIVNVKPEDTDGFENVLMLQNDMVDHMSTTFIRFDSFALMKAWMIDLNHEAHRLDPVDEVTDWWTKTFDKIECVPLKSNAPRRDAHSNRTESVRKVAAPHSNGHKEKHKSITFTEADLATLEQKLKLSADNGDSDDDEDDDYVEELRPRLKTSRNFFGSKPNIDPTTLDTCGNTLLAPPSKHDDALVQNNPISTRRASSTDYTSTSSMSSAASLLKSSSKKDGWTDTDSMSSKRTGKMKVKAPKVDKTPGPAPFDEPLARPFETPFNSLAGIQLSLRLLNVCGFLDKIFAVIYIRGSGDKTMSALDNKHSVHASPNASASAIASTKSSSSWTVLGRTEVRMVRDRPDYGENYVNDYKIHFCVLQPWIPESAKDIRVVVYRLENEMNSKEPAKATNLHLQLEIARCMIPKKIFDANAMLKVTMQVVVELPMDIAIPVFRESEILLGVMKLDSSWLFKTRSLLTTSFRCLPYSEVMYSFTANNVLTSSIEQLYASRYSVSTAESLLTLWYQERFDFMSTTLKQLRNELTSLETACDAMEKQRLLLDDTVNDNDQPSESMILDDNMKPLQLANADYCENFRHEIDMLEDFFNDTTDIANYLIEACDKAAHGDVINNIIDVEHGGSVLRRSTWKKITMWQYCTTNLNVHLLSSQTYNAADLHMLQINLHQYAQANKDKNMNETETLNNFSNQLKQSYHNIATITLGCPAAHEMKFHDGGLRKIFSELNGMSQKLRWMQALQWPNLDYLRELTERYPREAQSLFGHKYKPFGASSDYAGFLKRKFELCKRIDICASQALGGAVTMIRTIVVLATLVGGRYRDVLARSLKIGFVVMFESMLTTKGDELGMIEDLDVAAEWLSLVSIRLVTSNKPVESSKTYQDQPQQRKCDYKQLVPAAAEGEAKTIFHGAGEGVHCRRDSTGRLIVDIELDRTEAATVADVLDTMTAFECSSNTSALFDINTASDDISNNLDVDMDKFEKSLQFSNKPIVQYAPNMVAPRCLAVAEVVGIVFTQGINEMQTLAKISGARNDVQRQVDINNQSLHRLEEYYDRYKTCLLYQLARQSPQLLDAFSAYSAAHLASSVSNQTRGNANASFAASPTSSSMALGRSTTGASYLNSPSMSVQSLSPSTLNGRLMHRTSSRMSMASFITSPTKENVSAVVSQLTNKVITANDKMLDQLREEVALSTANPFEKYVNVLLKASSLCREMGGSVAILCKSGKDRTSMGVTLENTRSLVEDLGCHGLEELCQTMRGQGVRRMNVYANTGQSMFAFNQIQRMALPVCYRPPPGSHSGNVTS